MDIVIKGLTKSFGNNQVVQSTNLKIASGSLTTLLGPSGCGKTTLLRMIAGLEIPDEGEIFVGEEVIFSEQQNVNKPVQRRNFGMVFQDFALWPHMNVFENIAYSLQATGKKENLKDRVQEAIKRVRLKGMEERYPHQLSGGQQQRVAFARAVVMKPQLVLLDEPLSALDAQLRDELRTELMNMVREFRLTAIFVTHDQTEALAMSNKVVVMNNGQVLQVGTPEQIYQRPIHPFVGGFIGKANWIDKGKTMFRPEHIQSISSSGNHKFSGLVCNVAFNGDRYEVQLDMGDMGIWTAYHQERLAIGQIFTFYIADENIHCIS